MTDLDFVDQEMGALEGHELTIFDKSEPRSLINIVWKDMVPVIEKAEHLCKDLLLLPERKLKRRAKPDPIDDMLRLRFWQEYDRAQLVGGKMMQKDIIRGLCSKDYWEQVIYKDLAKLAYILLPMASYITRMESSLYIGLDEIDDILRLPHVDEETGRVDTRLIAEKVKIVQMLELRVKGAIVQKLAVHQRVDQTTQMISDPIDRIPLGDLESIDRRIEKVKRLQEQMQNRELRGGVSDQKEEAEIIDEIIEVEKVEEGAQAKEEECDAGGGAEKESI